MSSAGFPLNDLLRRKLQTSLIVATLTLSVASTLFLLLFSNRLGLIMAASSGTLTLGLTALFKQFIFFVSILVFIVGAVLASFIVFLMMAQRTHDFGLIKAAGCPNSLVGGYFMTELFTVTFIGCILGIVLGFVADFVASTLVFSSYQLPNFWFAPLVFIVFLVLAMFFGLRPIIKAAKMSPIKALSPLNYYGLSEGPKHKSLSKTGLTIRIAFRSLVRRQSATLRIVLLLSIVYILLTVLIAGATIANDTTQSWIQSTVDRNTVAIAHPAMKNQYKLLISMFAGAKETSDFNYSDPSLAISPEVTEKLNTLPGVGIVDARLILKGNVKEIANFTIEPETLATLPVGDSREGTSLVIGVDPQKYVGNWSLKGQFLGGNGELEAVIGDSISQTMYSPHPNRYVVLADPLVESISYQNTSFRIVGICIDPINNGFVTYVPIGKLSNVTGIFNPNLLLIQLNNSTDHIQAISQIRSILQASDSGLEVFDLSGVVEKNSAFLSSTWQTILLLPLFTLGAAVLSLLGYMRLSVDEQHQEFAVLRAIGAKPRLIINICTIQSAIVLVSSLAIGISLGIITTLLILMKNPLITSLTVVEIAVWLALASAAMFLLSLILAIRLSKAAILKIMS